MTEAQDTTRAPAPSSRRARLRALAIACVLAVEGVEALPAKPLTEHGIERPEGVRLLDWVTRALGVVGVRPGRQAIAKTLIATSGAIIDTRNRLLVPFEPLFRYTGTNQQWTLFIIVGRECFRMVVDGADASGEFHTRYRAQGIDIDRLAPLLEYRRLRGLYDPSRTQPPSEAYPGVVRFVAQRLFEAHPELRAVRVGMERLYVGPPDAPLLSLGIEHERSETRPQP